VGVKTRFAISFAPSTEQLELISVSYGKDRLLDIFKLTGVV
jgi:hypothetical protein